ncbi:hypothetical protein P171DRAFT_253993 [Karstenula rhodostoma CBS 690.94]|uniref:Uncharacterized protein n=1 Tax=Karstenula rhodostoma CBS 690.94 TaxID=1392251 RepID=A0A9P4PJF3_9PLEO|nr:hypothetical protein P171DRAFT_253993 [Karstenula rhodostoma CBS 690.94]
MSGDEEVIDFGELPERRPSTESGDGENPPDDASEFDADEALADLEVSNQNNDDGDYDNNPAGNDNDSPPALRIPKARVALDDEVHIPEPSPTSFTTNAATPHKGTKAAELEAAAGAPHAGPIYAEWSMGEGTARKPMQYICGRDWDDEGKMKGPCGVVLVKLDETLRCRNCGSRILLKKRTERMVQFEAR